MSVKELYQGIYIRRRMKEGVSRAQALKELNEPTPIAAKNEPPRS